MKMKIVLLSVLLLILAIDCRTKSKTKTGSKNKWFASRGVFTRPAYVASVARPVSAFYRPWYYPSAYYPSFRWRWLYGIPGYNIAYIRRYRTSCTGVCDTVSACSVPRAVPTESGNLKCICEAAGSEEIVTSYCWTPRACIRATSLGCNSIYARLRTRVVDVQRKRR